MGSETQQPSIPVIDLCNENLKPGTEAWLMACQNVKHALEEYGCFEVSYHRVPLELHKSMFSLLQDLFDLPLETRMQKTSDRPAHSYLGQLAPLPLYESLGVDNPTTPEGARGFTDIMWPAGNDQFCETAHSLSKLVEELYRLVTRMVFDIYGVERLYESHMASTSYLLRCFKYRTRQVNETNLGLYPHKDKSFISILHEDEIPGLQFKTKDGQWMDFQPSSSSSFLVIAGEPLMAWSNDRVYACEHQVILKENKARYSLGLFAFNAGIVQVPEELIDDKHPLLYKPFDHFDYLRFTLLRFAPNPEGTKSEYSIKAYCGV